jgi:pullulanase/glycogen debranching enzyme
MLDWNQLDQPEHHAMLEDAKKMIAVRKREADILALLPDQRRPHLIAVPYEGDIAVPVPYVRWNDRGAIIVAANRDPSQDAHLKLRIPLKEIGLAGHAQYRMTELWPEGKTESVSEEELAGYTCTIKRDKTEGGGLRVLKIEPKP